MRGAGLPRQSELGLTPVVRPAPATATGAAAGPADGGPLSAGHVVAPVTASAGRPAAPGEPVLEIRGLCVDYGVGRGRGARGDWTRT